jgi:hypothetical protein
MLVEVLIHCQPHEVSDLTGQIFMDAKSDRAVSGCVYPRLQDATVDPSMKVMEADY